MNTINKYARQAIFTKYYGPTDTKGSKIKAYCERGSVAVSYPDELSGEAVHAYAVEQLLAKFAKEDGNDKSWGTLANYACGASPRHEKSSYVFVNVRNPIASDLAEALRRAESEMSGVHANNALPYIRAALAAYEASR